MEFAVKYKAIIKLGTYDKEVECDTAPAFLHDGLVSLFGTDGVTYSTHISNVVLIKELV